MVNLRLSFLKVFNSNFNILNTLHQFSLKITMHYWKTFFYFIPKYILIRNSSFQENAKTKVYALEDSLGVHIAITYHSYRLAHIRLKGYNSQKSIDFLLSPFV